MRFKPVIRSRTIVSAALVTAAILFSLSCKGSELPGNWNATEIKTDGENTDWEGISGLVLEDGSAALKVANDDANLYLLMQLRDPQMARLIRMSGITVWLNDKGNKDKYFKLCYKGGPTPEELAAAGMADTLRSGSGDRIQMIPGPMMSVGEDFSCMIKDRLAEKSIPQDGSQGPAVASGISAGTIIYEFSIPLSDTEVKHYGLGIPPGADIGLGVIWGEFDREAMREQMGDRGGMGGGGRGGSKGGGRGGGMGGGRGGDPAGGTRPQMPEKQEIWIRSSLATGPETQM
jgi:hypothetical protein